MSPGEQNRLQRRSAALHDCKDLWNILSRVLSFSSSHILFPFKKKHTKQLASAYAALATCLALF